MKISLFVGLIMALVVSLVEFLFWDWSWIGTIVIIVVASSSAYAATVKHAAQRLDFVRMALKKIRKGTFEPLDLAAEQIGRASCRERV